jgi:hypothetical protein
LRQQPRVYVSGIIHEGKVTYTNVCIRLKGGPGSFRQLNDKPAFTINFERNAPGQKFHGLKKVHLNNSVQDRTYLSEKICRELFEAAGVPAPRAGHAQVTLNGQQLGPYVLIEGINKQFLSRYFKDPGGNLYDGHSQQDVNRRMRTNSGEHPEDPSGLRALAAAAAEPDLTERLHRLEAALDLDRFISFLATEIMICHWDGYALNRNNFRVFHDRANQRMVFLPQGVDQTFQRPNSSVFPNVNGLVAKAALEIPEVRDRYRERMIQLLTNVYRLDRLTNHIAEVASKFAASLAEDDQQAAASYPSLAASFSRRVQHRVHFLERQLLSVANESKIDPSGVIKLTGWQPQIDLGQPILRREEGTDGRGPLLSIRAEESGAGSWRTRLWLDKGRYRFEGRVLLAGVQLSANDPKAGAGLRISRKKFGHPTPASQPWTATSFEFDVADDHIEIELVCELRALAGQAWFDLNSLQLTREE